MVKNHLMLTRHVTTSNNNVTTSILFIFGTQLVKLPSMGHGKGGRKDQCAC